MIKMMFCLKRKADLTMEEFLEYWLERHAPLVRSYASDLNIRRYVQSHSLPESMAKGGPRGSEAVHFDGVAELWWDNWESFTEPHQTAQGRAAGLALLEDERNFIDLAHSPIFFTREHVIVG